MHNKDPSLGFRLCWYACLWVAACLVRESLCLPRENLISGSNSPAVQLHDQGPGHVLVENGFVQVLLSKPEGHFTKITYNGIDNLLEFNNPEDDRGYWDVFWYKPEEKGSLDKLEGTNFRVITQDENQIELSFARTWNLSIQGSRVPLNVDKRLVMRRGDTGFYIYAIMERLQGWPDVDMDEIRMVFKPQNDKFHYMAVSDFIQRSMPTARDRETGQPLAYPEAVVLTHPENPKFKGEVDDKYQYAIKNSESKVRGWVSDDPPTGFWMIAPSMEFLAGGPTKQDLTCHVGPTLLTMFTGMHYTGKDLNTEYRNGEPWKKVFGPVFVYLNSNASVGDHRALWNDAKRRMSIEETSWPYSFMHSPDLPSSNQRGTVLGTLMVRDGNIRMPAKFAYVGLASPGNAGSWQFDAKGYQFWTQTDSRGNFVIKNIRTGDYNLYAWVPGFIGDYKHPAMISIKPGRRISMGILSYVPPRNGPTLWEIGIPDRSAAEFFVPDPRPTLVNRLFKNIRNEKYRQYGLWERYTDLHHKEDLIYTVGTSNYTKDWFFAHVLRDAGDDIYQPTTWQMSFELQAVKPTANYTLQLALASASVSDLQVHFNERNTSSPYFSTGIIGKDNAIARHGIHGLYRLYSINVPGHRLVEGKNTICLTQAKVSDPFQGVMYDYIRLEGPR